MTACTIGVFDSGLGGLTCVREIFRQNPNASVIYVADIAHVPYGGRPLAEVKQFALGITRYLVEEGADAVLMACNMSSAVALHDARRAHPEIPVFGVIEAGARSAVRLGRSQIGVLATAGTVMSRGYVRAIQAAAPGTSVLQTACPRFVPLIESGQLDGREVEEAARDYLQPGLKAGVQVFILGCTHYPLLMPTLMRLTPPDVMFVDPAAEAVAETLWAIQVAGGPRRANRFILTAPSETFRPVGARFLGRDLPDLELVQWNLEGRLEAAAPVSSCPAAS